VLGNAFITVNCAAVPSSLIASELFGHEKGAFLPGSAAATGPYLHWHTPARFFLDEIGVLSAKLRLQFASSAPGAPILNEWGVAASFPTDVRISPLPIRDLRQAIY